MSQALDVEQAKFQVWMCQNPCNAKGFEGGKLSILLSTLQKLMTLLRIHIYISSVFI